MDPVQQIAEGGDVPSVYAALVSAIKASGAASKGGGAPVILPWVLKSLPRDFVDAVFRYHEDDMRLIDHAVKIENQVTRAAWVLALTEYGPDGTEVTAGEGSAKRAICILPGECGGKHKLIHEAIHLRDFDLFIRLLAAGAKIDKRTAEEVRAPEYPELVEFSEAATHFRWARKEAIQFTRYPDLGPDEACSIVGDIISAAEDDPLSDHDVSVNLAAALSIIQSSDVGQSPGAFRLIERVLHISSSSPDSVCGRILNAQVSEMVFRLCFLSVSAWRSPFSFQFISRRSGKRHTPVSAAIARGDLVLVSRLCGLWTPAIAPEIIPEAYMAELFSVNRRLFGRVSAIVAPATEIAEYLFEKDPSPFPNLG